MRNILDAISGIHPKAASHVWPQLEVQMIRTSPTSLSINDARGATNMATTETARTIETATIEDTSLTAFYRDMNAPERRTFWACAAGWALDGMDFWIYPLVIGTIIAMWNVD